MDVSATLNEAAEALEQGAGARVLDALLRTWRLTRAPEVAAVIEALSPRLERAPLPAAKTQKQQLLDWIARARLKNPADLHLLLQALEVIVARGRPSQIAPAVEELIEWPDDPRLGHRAVRMIEAQIATQSFPPKLWGRLTKLVVACGDPTTLEPMRRVHLLPSTHEWIAGLVAERLPRVLVRFEARLGTLTVRALDAAEQRQCEALARAIVTAELDPELDVRPDGARSHEEVLAAVYAAPGDHALRLVLADLLQEAGDPRGELISLQFNRLSQKPTRNALARERELLRDHASAWIGGLSRLAYKGSLQFERGFLVSCKLKTVKAARAAAERGHPEWATVERVEFAAGTSGWGSIVSPHMRSMRALIHMCLRGLKRLCLEHHDLPIEQIVLFGRGYRYQPVQEVALLTACEGLAQLRTLQLAVTSSPKSGLLEPLWQAPLGARLQTLVLAHAPAASWLAAWHAGDVPVSRIAVTRWSEFWMAERVDGALHLRARIHVRPGEAPRAIQKKLLEAVPAAELERYAHCEVAVVGGDAEIAERALSELRADRLVVRAAKEDDPAPWDVAARNA